MRTSSGARGTPRSSACTSSPAPVSWPRPIGQASCNGSRSWTSTAPRKPSKRLSNGWNARYGLPRSDNGRPTGRLTMMRSYCRSHLRTLEDEAVHILRELAAERERPCLLFSGGKDSIVLLRLAEKAFRPARFPFPLLHVDTGHNFPETLEYRDRTVAALGERLIVASVQDSI